MLPLYLTSWLILCTITWQIHPTLSAMTFCIGLIGLILLRDKIV